jgi:hypothetical protein
MKPALNISTRGKLMVTSVRSLHEAKRSRLIF